MALNIYKFKHDCCLCVRPMEPYL